MQLLWYHMHGMALHGMASHGRTFSVQSLWLDYGLILIYFVLTHWFIDKVIQIGFDPFYIWWQCSKSQWDGWLFLHKIFDKSSNAIKLEWITSFILSFLHLYTRFTNAHRSNKIGSGHNWTRKNQIQFQTNEPRKFQPALSLCVIGFQKKIPYQFA